MKMTTPNVFAFAPTKIAGGRELAVEFGEKTFNMKDVGVNVVHENYQICPGAERVGVVGHIGAINLSRPGQHLADRFPADAEVQTDGLAARDYTREEQSRRASQGKRVLPHERCMLRETGSSKPRTVRARCRWSCGVMPNCRRNRV